MTLTGGSIPQAGGTTSGTCTVTVDVTSTTPGVHTNTLDAGALVTDKGSNLLPASATLTVNPSPATDIPPTLGKVFFPVAMDVGGVSTLTITLSNPNTSGPAIIDTLTDKLPSGVGISGTIVSPQCGGQVTAATDTLGITTVTLTGGSIPQAVGTTSGTCTVTVDVTSTTPGVHTNTLDAGALVTDKGSNEAQAIATLTVAPVIIAPTLGKAFSPATIDAGGVSTLTITLSNPNTSGDAQIATLTDKLPSGVVIAAHPNASSGCGGTVTANPGGSTVTLTGGLIPANGTCTVTVKVTAKSKGSYCNKLPAGALQTNMGSNAAPAHATLTVICTAGIPPTLGKSFSPATIKAGGVSTLTITLNNPNSTVANLTAPLTDYLPSGMVIAAIPNAGTTCSGSGGVSAYAGGTKVTLPATRSIPANGSCTVTVKVTAKYKGSYCNKLPAGALQTNKGSNTTSAVATLAVLTN